LIEYSYMKIDIDDIDYVLNEMALRGWTVHTINRNINASLIDALFERSTQKASTGPR
jgi:hypothetical protein